MSVIDIRLDLNDHSYARTYFCLIKNLSQSLAKYLIPRM